MRAHRARSAVLAAALLGALPAAWAGAALVHYLRVREDVRAGRLATIEVGPRDLFFTGRGWYRPLALGNLRIRCSRGPRASLWLPVEPGREYHLSLRLAPFSFAGAPPQAVQIGLDGRPLTDLPLPADPRWSRIYTIRLPAGTGRGHSRLDLRARYAASTDAAGGGDQGLPGGLDTALLLRFVRLAPAPPPIAVAGR